MSERNRASHRLSQLKMLPSALRGAIITRIFGHREQFAGMAGVTIDELSEDRAVAFLSDTRKVQNHIGAVHEAAIALLAESATGAVFAMNVADSHEALLQEMNLRYRQGAQGGLRAVAALTEAARDRIATEPRGAMEVPVTITDATGEEPIRASLTWGWAPKGS
jgi:uncharacterized protein (TIGR00369 family)